MSALKLHSEVREANAKYRADGSADAAKLFNPEGQHDFRGGIDVHKLDTHADAGLDDAYNTKSLDLLVFALQGDARAAIHQKGATGADEASAERKVGSHALDAGAGGHVQQFGVRGKRITDGIAAIPQRRMAKWALGASVVHRNYV